MARSMNASGGLVAGGDAERALEREHLGEAGHR